jgi:hypothetical protein
MLAGEITEARGHFNQAIAFYDPDGHRPLATRFGEDQTWQPWCRDHAINLGFPPGIRLALGGWLYPEAALRATDEASRPLQARSPGREASPSRSVQSPK